MPLKSFILFSFLLLPLSSHGEDTFPFPSAVATNELAPQVHTLDGVVEAVKKATISAQVSGRVIEVNFDIDDYVEKGSVIIRIRDKEYKARLASAKAALKEATANHKDAKLEFKRVKGLFKDKIVSASNFDKAKAALKATEARVAASEARITEANEQLSNTIIKAPYDGIVTARHIEPGETMKIGQAIMTGFSMSQLRVSTDVPQTYINAIRQHKKALISYLENKGQSLSATKLTIFPFANPKSHTFRVRAALPNNTKNLFPGMLVKVAFEIDNKARLMIPTSAIAHRSEVSAVYVIGANQALHLRQVRTGKQFGNKTEVLAGLDENEVVATDPIRAGVYLKQQLESK
ncbi:MAG: efflux RND transporter periplasmic adaptor subunit [Gammaproteobacteria bacterium]|nr:efflux RND transporter periplasmic adaptor subunit [Gammaproteobacteria bacterium]